MLARIVLVLLNVWMWAQWRCLRWPCRGPRQIDRAVSELRRFQSFVLTAVTDLYGRTALALVGYRRYEISQADA